ncbi:biopolymer transporter ExbD [Paracoccus jeotgali]|uniref:Biopolymer transporter ExbD n=1 Tax=Paracoccus jeotgali TaxID=2065379 RepID=A0A2K9MDP3_9RHOB|nr:biopolymer transporter ExbD [Paracoccus jeotgali]AUM73733.1 biopolymer transporter ExbD [Paracoccus jeotgali]
MALDLPRRRRERGRLDHSLPIVNIVLLLLFFFMLVGQLPPPESDTRLATTSRLPLSNLPHPVLQIEADGQWRLDGREVSPELLPSALPPDGEPVLHVMIDRAAPARLLVEALAHPALSGLTLQLVTLNQPEEP